MKRLIASLSIALLASVPTASLAGGKNDGDKLQFTIMWPGDIKADIDMKILAPDESKVVDFRWKHGKHIALTRDELLIGERPRGAINPPPNPPVYFETALSDSVRPGSYVINVVGYHGEFPAPITLLVDKISRLGGVHRVMVAKATLSHVRDEKTIASFVIDNVGKIDRESVSQTYQQIGVQYPLSRYSSGIWVGGR